MRQVDFMYKGVNQTLFVHDNEDLSNHIHNCKEFYEQDILEDLATYGPFKNVLDIGANIGNHTAYFLRNWDVKTVISVEPVLANYSLLLCNIQGDRRATPRHCALGATTGAVEVVTDDVNMGCCRIQSGGKLVQQRTLDSIVGDDVDFIKIDVEGAEMEVLKGATATLKKLPALFIEGNSAALQEHLSPLGYTLAKTYPYSNYLFLARTYKENTI